MLRKNKTISLSNCVNEALNGFFLCFKFKHGTTVFFVFFWKARIVNIKRSLFLLENKKKQDSPNIELQCNLKLIKLTVNIRCL